MKKQRIGKIIIGLLLLLVGCGREAEETLPETTELPVQELVFDVVEEALEMTVDNTGIYYIDGQMYCALALATEQPELLIMIESLEADEQYADASEEAGAGSAAAVEADRDDADSDDADGENEDASGEDADGENEDAGGDDADSENEDADGDDADSGNGDADGEAADSNNADGENVNDGADDRTPADDRETGEDESTGTTDSGGGAADTPDGGRDAGGDSDNTTERDTSADDRETGDGEQEQRPAEVIQANSRVIPETIADMPSNYYSASAHPGSLVDFYYDTYESFSYAEHTTPLRKHAVIYLPYGYNEGQQYEVFYYMHGGGNNEHAMLGTTSSPTEFKNFLDHAIEDGKIKPVIFVCLTYNNTSARDSSNFQLSMQLCRNYHNELVNDVLPAVEGTYSTYASGTSAAELRASRDHRGFGGFSNGSVCTWRVFQYELGYFHYFLPISCGTTLDDATIQASAAGWSPHSFFVYMMTGTSDAAYSYDTNRARSLQNSPYFIENSESDLGNFAYRAKRGYQHRDVSARVYTYNAFCFFYG